MSGDIQSSVNSEGSCVSSLTVASEPLMLHLEPVSWRQSTVSGLRAAGIVRIRDGGVH